MKSPREVAATRDVRRLRLALRELLNDTQHFWHSCEDEHCPVKLARRALTETDTYDRERPCMKVPKAKKPTTPGKYPVEEKR